MEHVPIGWNCSEKKKGLHILMYCKELLYVKNKSY